MPLTDDEFVNNKKLEEYVEIINKLHDEEEKLPEFNYEFEDEEEDDD